MCWESKTPFQWSNPLKISLKKTFTWRLRRVSKKKWILSAIRLVFWSTCRRPSARSCSFRLINLIRKSPSSWAARTQRCSWQGTIASIRIKTSSVARNQHRGTLLCTLPSNRIRIIAWSKICSRLEENPRINLERKSLCEPAARVWNPRLREMSRVSWKLKFRRRMSPLFRLLQSLRSCPLSHRSFSKKWGLSHRLSPRAFMFRPYSKWTGRSRRCWSSGSSSRKLWTSSFTGMASRGSRIWVSDSTWMRWPPPTRMFQLAVSSMCRSAGLGSGSTQRMIARVQHQLAS